jgi:phosphoserine phosphatase
MHDPVVTLVAQDGQLTTAQVDRVAATVSAARIDWLAPATACDIFCAAPPADISLDGADVFIQPTESRRQKILLADMESTLIEQELLDELAARRGVADEVRRITQAGMEGKTDFVQGLQARMQLLRATTLADVQTVLDAATFSAGAEVLVRTLAAYNIPTWIISSGLTLFTQVIAERLGAAHHEGNVAGISDDMFDGTIAGPVRDKYAKQAAVARAAQTVGGNATHVAAVGDGANDILMLQAAGAGFAFHAKPAVAAATRHRIQHSDLTAILYAMGFRKGEFVQ